MNQSTGDGSEVEPKPTGSLPNSPTMESLVADFLPAVYRYAFRLAGSAPDAEDLVQQAFLIAQQRLEQLRDSSKARAWLFAILRSCFLKRLRKSTPQIAGDLDMDLGQVSAPWNRESEIDAEGLRIALSELSDHDRTVLLMFYFEDASYKQIAEELDLKLGTVMSRLSRAKDHLRQRLVNRAEFQ
jgi:RNA polymerase sigma-70 factor (ECF subfamily)